MKIIYNVVEMRSNGDCNLANPASSINEAMHSICFYLKCEKAECEGSSIHIDGNDFYVRDKKGSIKLTPSVEMLNKDMLYESLFPYPYRILDENYDIPDINSNNY